MRYYAAWGHNEFILCLGYKGDVDPRVLPQLQRGALQRLRARGHGADARVELLDRQVQRLAGHLRRHRHADDDRRTPESGRAVPGDDEEFLATYGDGLTDAPLDAMIESFRASGKLIQFLSVRPQFNAHVC